MVFLSCQSGTRTALSDPPPVSAESTAPVEPARVRIPVTTVVATTSAFPYMIHSNGKIRSSRDQVISAMSGGLLLSCKARTGAFFKAGEVIAQLDPAAVQNRLERARLSQFNGEKEFESQMLGYETLLKDKTPAEADKIRQKLRISSGLAGAERDMSEADDELKKTVIRAPFSGVLADVKAQEGEALKPGEDLFRIYDSGDLFLEVKILESDLPELKLQTPAELSPVSDDKIRFPCVVQEINPYVDENGMILVKLRVTRLHPVGGGGGFTLFPGMNCTAVIQTPRRQTLSVPREALVMRSGQPVVFTLEDGKARWNYVTLGKENDREVEITRGIRTGQKIILSNNLQLEDDVPVEDSSVNHR